MFLRLNDLINVGFGPLPQLVDNLPKSLSQRRQRIRHPGGYARKDLAMDEAIALEGANGLRKHFLGNPFNFAPQLARSSTVFEKAPDN